MTDTVVIDLDAQDIISGKLKPGTIVKSCSLKNAGLLIKNSILFFDDDHPEYAGLFDAILAGCDGAGVKIMVEGMDESEFLSDDFMKAMARLRLDIPGNKKDARGSYHII
jgi:hypothetical protein